MIKISNQLRKEITSLLCNIDVKFFISYDDYLKAILLRKIFKEEVLMIITSKEDFRKKNSTYLIRQKLRDSIFELVLHNYYSDIKIDDVSKFLFEQLEAIVFLFNIRTKSK